METCKCQQQEHQETLREDVKSLIARYNEGFTSLPSEATRNEKRKPTHDAISECIRRDAAHRQEKENAVSLLKK
jgi:hypothetical protein